MAAEYPNFTEHLDRVLRWYEKHIEGCVSPVWDDRKDKEIIQALTTAHVPSPADGQEGDIVAELIRRIEPLQVQVDAANELVAEAEKALKQLKDQLKAELEARMKDSDKKIEAKGTKYIVEVVKSAASGVDTERLKKDGLYDKYKKIRIHNKNSITED